MNRVVLAVAIIGAVLGLLALTYIVLGNTAAGILLFVGLVVALVSMWLRNPSRVKRARVVED